MKKLSKEEQMSLISAIPESRLLEAGKIFNTPGGMMCGKGVGDDILRWLGKNIGPIFKELSNVVIKEILIPLVKKKVGLGLNPAGMGMSRPSAGLKLAGQGKHGMGMKKDTGKGSQAMKDRMAQLRSLRTFKK